MFGEVGVQKGQFFYPRAIESDADSIWIVDKAARVQRFDASTGAWRCGWHMPEWELGKPCGITIAPGPDGAPCLYVADTHYHRVILYHLPPDGAETGDEIARFGGYGDGSGQFIFTTDVAVQAGPDGRPVRIFVSEYGGNDRINVFGPDHRFQYSFGSLGSGPDEFNRPQSIALDADRGHLVVADACNHRIGIFTLEGRIVRWIGSPENAGTAPGCFRYPYGLRLLSDGAVLVAEFGNSRVQKIDLATGRSLGVYGLPGNGEGELSTPWGVTTIGGRAFVLDSGNNRVVACRIPGIGG